MKKVVVVPYTEYEKMKYTMDGYHHEEQQQQQQQQKKRQQQQQTSFRLYDPRIEKLNKYERELTQILNSNLNVYKKCALYQNAIQSLVDLKDLHNHSIPNNSYEKSTPDPPQPNGEHVEENKFQNILEQTLPARIKNKGIVLYNILKDQLLWDEAGQIIIDDETVEGSNISDLISDLTREWKKPPITGWHKIKQELQTINFPKSLIQNKQRLSDLENIPYIPRPSISSPSSSFASMRSKSKITRTPYPPAKNLRKKAEALRGWIKM